nr:hypothetical protein [Micromonospora sp. DSM 115978]
MLAAMLLLALPEAVRAKPLARSGDPTSGKANLAATALQPTGPAAAHAVPLPPEELPEVPEAGGATLSLGAAVSDEQAALLARPTAMWVWTWTNSAAVVAYALANNVNHIFAYTAPGFTRPGYVPPGWTIPMLPVVTDLSIRARDAGIRVDAMGGDPSWVNNPPIARNWALESLGTGLFTGLHVEIEP